MKEWFEQLALRERLLISIAGGLVILLLVVTLGIRPIMNKASRSYELIDDKQSLLNDISRLASRIGPQTGSRQDTHLVDAQSLVVLVDRATRERGLAGNLTRNQPDGTSSIRLRFENASFDTLMEWLTQLQNQYGLSTTAANIDMSSGPGRVNCNLTLERTGA